MFVNVFDIFRAENSKQLVSKYPDCIKIPFKTDGVIKSTCTHL